MTQNLDWVNGGEAVVTFDDGRVVQVQETFAASQWIATGNEPHTIDVRAHGALCDDTTDDTVAVQAAVNAAPGSGTPAAKVVVPGPCRITDTIDINGRSIILVGAGGGQASRAGGALRWDGSAGLPMIRLEDTYGCELAIRLIGHDTNIPSAGVEIAANVTPTFPDNQMTLIRDMTIGPDPFPSVAGTGGRVARGVHITGATSCDGNSLRNVTVFQPTVAGVDIENPQAIWTQLDRVRVAGRGVRVPIGIRSSAGLLANTCTFAYCDICFDADSATGELTVVNMGAENCYQLLTAGNNLVAKFLAGRFHAGAVPAATKLVDWDTLAMGNAGSFSAEHLHLLSMPVSRPTLAFSSTQQWNRVAIEGCRGLELDDIVFTIGASGGVAVQVATEGFGHGRAMLTNGETVADIVAG